MGESKAKANSVAVARLSLTSATSAESAANEPSRADAPLTSLADTVFCIASRMRWSIRLEAWSG